MRITLPFLAAVGTAALIINLLTFKNTRRIMSQADDLDLAVQGALTAIEKLKTDTATALADIAAKLASDAANSQDPKLIASVSNAIRLLNKAASDVSGIDTSIVAADPGADTGTGTPTPLPPGV